ncbi:hypothetical protein COC42_14845 [Sphingomonas spermidinifaciens]|uniref:Uncharacterized protein n=1 Tax=Sphingomonas spermidinifaciens TaxID=1141889 RepID=A0A2A4B3Y7_9SPHN|nr:hypothetical protein COC42_14845 [Sphingomonas spermidinifaciens]
MSHAEAAIRTARLHWNAAIAAGDAVGAVGPITRDCVLVPAGGVPLAGRPAIARAWRRLLAAGTAAVALSWSAIILHRSIRSIPFAPASSGPMLN